MPNATGTFNVVSFNEDTYEERDAAAKLTHAWGDQEFSGDITGRGNVHWLMSYRSDKSARYVGLERIDGTLDGKSGSFIIEATGDFDGARSRGTWTVVPGSGTGDFSSISGTGTFNAPSGPTVEYELDYELG